MDTEGEDECGEKEGKAEKENRVCAARLRERIRPAGAALRGWASEGSRDERASRSRKTRTPSPPTAMATPSEDPGTLCLPRSFPPSLTLYFRCLLHSQLLSHSTGKRFICITAKAAQLHHTPVSSLHLHGRVARARGGRGAGGGVSKFWTCCRPCSPSFREKQLGHQRNFASSAPPNHILLPRLGSFPAFLASRFRTPSRHSSLSPERLGELDAIYLDAPVGKRT